MTRNVWKIAEYRRFLGRHAQTLLVEQPTESTEVLSAWLSTSRAVVTDESNIFDPAGDLVDARYVGPARNICRLHAWVKDDTGRVARRSYIREVAGQFDGAKLRPGDSTVFDWDAAFTPGSGATLEELAQLGLKNSAREQCLSAFVKAYLHHKERKTLRWTPAEATDWATDARLLLEHPLYQALEPKLQHALHAVIEGGVFFRSAKSRRDGNYWFPGLNGGLPYVPKSDPVHEATYLFHDVMHQLMPDLVFDGASSVDHRNVYIAYRMMSEAVSLVLADMVFVRGLSLRPELASYDFTKRRIFPLFQVIERKDDLRWLTRQVAGYVLRGEPGELPVHSEGWKQFEAKYSRFFVADFQWTRMNWQNLVARSDMVRAWLALLHPATFRAQGIWFISDMVEKVGRGLSLEVLLERMFDQVWSKRIAPALAFEGAPDVARSTSNGFRRWLTGQCAFFARYEPIIGLPPLAQELAARVRDARPFEASERSEVRARFGDFVRAQAKTGLISDDDAALFPELFPLFDPYFLRDYDEAQQEFASVREASAKAFG